MNRRDIFKGLGAVALTAPLIKHVEAQEYLDEPRFTKATLEKLPDGKVKIHRARLRRARCLHHPEMAWGYSVTLDLDLAGRELIAGSGPEPIVLNRQLDRRSFESLREGELVNAVVQPFGNGYILRGIQSYREI